MKQRRLEDILEECLAAYFEGRRSIEDSLSRYAGVSAHLEPLLRTAASFSNSFSASGGPAPEVQERGLQRFLAAVRSRAAVRSLARSVRATPAEPWGRRHWAFLGGAVAAVLGVVLVTAVALSNGGGDGDGPFVFETGTSSAQPVAPVVRDFRQHVDALKAKQSQGQRLEREEIERVTEIASQIEPEDLDAASLEQLKATVPEAFAVLNTVARTQPSESGPVREALSATNELAAGAGVPEFTPPAASETPPAIETPTETPVPPTETATPAETATPTPLAETPAATEEARGVGPADSFPLPAPANIDPLATPAP